VEKTDKEAFKVKSKKLEDNEGTTAREWFENQRKVKEDGGNDDEEEDNVVVSTSGCGLLDRLKTHFLRRLDQENELDKRFSADLDRDCVRKGGALEAVAKD